ncbi:hypothetical protein EL84_15445 [Paenibacillus sp. VT-400]|nr:hypothetical protein EL84_15445 [Paenibacillus sp. VT-400]
MSDRTGKSQNSKRLIEKKEVNLSELPHRYVIHFSQQNKTFGQRVAGQHRTARLVFKQEPQFY